MMHTGMLWFQNDPQMTLKQKINQAADYYQRKYGRAPNLALVHPSMFGDEKEIKIDGMAVRPYRPVLKGHIWVGIDESADIDAVKKSNEARS